MTKDTKRLNITLPAHTDALLGELAALTGRTKASFVQDAVAWSVPHWRKQAGALRETGTPARQADESKVAEVRERLLTRKQRRQLEREARMKGGSG